MYSNKVPILLDFFNHFLYYMMNLMIFKPMLKLPSNFTVSMDKK